MYHAKIWDEDKLDIHSQSYGSAKYGSIFSESKKDDVKYHEQKYGSGDGNPSSDYMRKHEEEKKDDEKEKGFLEELEDDKKKEDNASEEDIQLKAARQIFAESRQELKRDTRKKELSTIDEAIRKAIEQEKSVIIMDN